MLPGAMVQKIIQNSNQEEDLGVSQFEQKHVMPTPGQSPGQAAVGIHFEIEKAMFGFPLEFIPWFIRDGNDKLRHYRGFG